MSGTDLKAGDQVVYQDKDSIRWGPWKVASVKGDRATVVIEDRVTYAVKTSLLQKIRLTEEPV